MISATEAWYAYPPRSFWQHPAPNLPTTHLAAPNWPTAHLAAPSRSNAHLLAPNRSSAHLLAPNWSSAHPAPRSSASLLRCTKVFQITRFPFFNRRIRKTVGALVCGALTLTLTAGYDVPPYVMVSEPQPLLPIIPLLCRLISRSPYPPRTGAKCILFSLALPPA